MNSQLPAGQRHPLLGLFDKDPGRWRPLHYGVRISVGVANGGIGSGSIQLNNQPFIMTRITHKVVGETGDPTNSGVFNDGQYSVVWKDEQSNYQKGVIPADLMWGNYGSSDGGNGGGFVMNLPFPLPYAGNKALTFDLTNDVTRVIDAETHFTVAICVSGIADWGTLQTRR